MHNNFLSSPNALSKPVHGDRLFGVGRNMLAEYDQLHSYLRERLFENGSVDNACYLKVVESPDRAMQKFVRSRELELATMAFLKENGIPHEFRSKEQDLPADTRDWLRALRVDKRALEVQEKVLEYMEERIACFPAAKAAQEALLVNQNEVPAEYLEAITVRPDDIQKLFGNEPALLFDAKYILSKLKFVPFKSFKPVIATTIFSPIFLRGQDFLVCPKLLLVSMLFRVAFMLRYVLAHSSDTA